MLTSRGPQDTEADPEAKDGPAKPVEPGLDQHDISDVRCSSRGKSKLQCRRAGWRRGQRGNLHSGIWAITRGWLVVPVQVSDHKDPRASPEGRPCVVAGPEMPLPRECQSWPAVGEEERAVSAARTGVYPTQHPDSQARPSLPCLSCTRPFSPPSRPARLP